jgi:hypothetical protein
MRNWLFEHSNNFVSGVIMSITAYYTPCKGVIYVAIGAVLLDFVTGIIASLIEKKGIKSSKLWKTLFKLFFVVLFIMLLYSMDAEFHIIELHRLVAWLIVGFEAWSILENMARITDHRIFRILKKFMEDRIEKQTGIDLNEED